MLSIIGVEWFFNNLNQDGLIYPEFKNNQHIHDHFESHHAPYIILPLMQAVLMGQTNFVTPYIKSKIKLIFNQLEEFKDKMVTIIGLKTKMASQIIH